VIVSYIAWVVCVGKRNWDGKRDWDGKLDSKPHELNFGSAHKKKPHQVG